MMDLTLHPRECEVCRSGRASYCLQRFNRVTGRTWQQWLCPECYEASHPKTKKEKSDAADQA